MGNVGLHMCIVTISSFGMPHFEFWQVPKQMCFCPSGKGKAELNAIARHNYIYIYIYIFWSMDSKPTVTLPFPQKRSRLYT